MLGGLIVTAFTLPLVGWLGQGDTAKGYQLTMAAMSMVGIVMFLLCFVGTKERVFPPANQHSTFKDDLKSLWQNDQWRVLSAAALFVLVGLVMRSTLAIYYVKYYLGRGDLITQFMTLGMLGNILGCALAVYLTKYVCKVRAYIALQLISAVICVLSYFIAREQIVLAFVAYFAWSFMLQMATPLLWAKIADTVDYGQMKTGIRITGMTYSSVVFFIKMGLAIGGALAGWLLALYGYQADQPQSMETLQGMLLSFTVFPAIAFVMVAIIMCRYTLVDKEVEKIQVELKKVARSRA
jgi:GPH family glycoside/pentoside/hexuronide:cation symporter